MMNIGRIAGLLCLVSCAHGADRVAVEPHSRGIAHYTVTIFDNLGGARVRACFNGVALADLVPIDGSAASRLRGAWIDGIPLEIRDGRILLESSNVHPSAWSTKPSSSGAGLGSGIPPLWSFLRASGSGGPNRFPTRSAPRFVSRSR